MHWMIGGEAHVAGLALRHGDREDFSERSKSRRLVMVAAAACGDDERVFRLRDHVRRALDGREIGERRTRRHMARRRRIREVLDGRGQHFARQREIHGALGLAHRQVERAVDGRFQNLRVLEFVIPLDDFAQHAGLIAHFLRPVNFAAARAGQTALFAVRRASGRKDDGKIAAPCVEHAAHGVRHAHIDVNHNELRLAGLQIVAKRHMDGDVLVGHRDGARHLAALRLELGERFNQRRKVGAGVGEQKINAAVGENFDVGVGDRAALDNLLGHASKPSR